MPKKAGPLRCCLCTKRFDTEDVANLEFFPTTSTCFGCYQKFAKSPFQGPKGTCFGKENEVSESGKITGYGYDPLGSTDCSIHCPHREICVQFAEKTVYKERAYLVTPYTGQSAKALQALLKGISRLKAKTVLADAKVKRDALRGLYMDTMWLVDRTHRAYKAYKIRKVKIRK